MTVDPDTIKRLRELAEAATPGPWSRTRDNGVHAGKPKRCIGSMYDSEYVAAANPETVIALLDGFEWAVAMQKALMESQERLAQQLAAMTKARDEACRLAEIMCTSGESLVMCQHIAELRKVGR